MRVQKSFLASPSPNVASLDGRSAQLEDRGFERTGPAWLVGRREEIENVALDDWTAKLRTDDDARASVTEYLAELYGAAVRLFGLEGVPLDCCFGDGVATEPVHLEDATREVERPAAATFGSSDTLANPRAHSGSG